ncbi:MAG: hypothetical protein QM704_10815 [Anaeromyxobacteraceae bacterium]
MSDPGGSDRRSFLQGVAVALGGFAVTSCAGASPGATGASHPTGPGASASFLASAHLSAPPPVDGVPVTTLGASSGSLVDARTGAGAGSFRAQPLDPSDRAGLFIHQLTLTGGALYAVGPESGPECAVLGGTGAYAGVRGTLLVTELSQHGGSRELALDLSLS